jgi:beta-glucosidase/6-phospho-beta-glucosidase/beta-galactosidase
MFNTVYEEHKKNYLKLIAAEFQKLIQRVRTFSEDICMELEIYNCAKIALKKNKSLHSQHLQQQLSTKT